MADEVKMENGSQGEHIDRRTSLETTTSSHSDGNSSRQVKRRNRIPVSCTECRRRKLRCDRNDPCSACVQRGDTDQCKFTEPLAALQKPRNAAKPGSREFLQQRIHRLESLVTDLAAQVRHSNSPPSNTDSSQSPEQRTLDQSDVSSHTSPSHTGPEVDASEPTDKPIDDLRIAMGDMKVSNGKVLYTSGNSWNTILDEIADIKLAMNPIYSSYHAHSSTAGLVAHRPSSFPFFASAPPSISDFLALLPSQADTDALVNKYLTTMLTTCPIIHRPTFETNLQQFYLKPDAADPIFLGTLFAMMASAISIYAEDTDVTKNIVLQKGVADRKEMGVVWRDASMQAFSLGGFLTNTTLDNIQGLIILHTYLNAFQSNLNLGWPLYGMIVSIALNMGLHRDGEQFGLDAYETEMRRRVWCCLVMLDGLNAATFGRPMMISDTQFDTKPLSSLNDGDLHRGLKFPLPHKNPNTFTDTTYAKAKYSLSMVSRKIISSVFGIKPPSYETILRLDGAVRETYVLTPDVMRFESIHSLKSKLPAPSVAIAVQRIGLTLVANHALVILHRPFLYRSFRDARYMPSREKCVDAAHQVLRLFHEYRNNPDFAEYSWYVMGALHAFHAGTVIGLLCYLEPLSCSEIDWMALNAIRNDFERVANGLAPGWVKLGEKGGKVFSILIRKAIERKAILEGALGSKGVTIGPSPTVPPANNTTPAESSPGFSGMNFTPSGDGYSSSTGLTPQYSGQPLFGTNQFDVNPLTNPAVDPYGFRAGTMLLGAGIPGVGVATSDSSPEQQPNWDIFLPKGTNLSEWDLFFDNMDLDVSNLGGNSSGNGGVSFDQGNPFSNPATAAGGSSGPMEWNFGQNPTFGGNMM